MSATVLCENVLLVALEAACLCLLSRILFAWGLVSIATRRRGGGWLIQLLRLPGNLLHEISHAIGYFVCGYRVKRLTPCILDPKGRGICQPGAPWSPIAVPWLATGVAAIFPLIVGALVLRALAELLDIPFTAGGTAPDEGPVLGLLDSVRSTLQAMDYHDWRTYLFFYLAFSVGSELAPSEVDLRRSMAPLGVIAAVLAGAIFYLGFIHPESAAWHTFSTWLSRGADRLLGLLGFGILATALVAVVTVVPALVLRALRSVMGRADRAEARY